MHLKKTVLFLLLLLSRTARKIRVLLLLLLLLRELDANFKNLDREVPEVYQLSASDLPEVYINSDLGCSRRASGRINNDHCQFFGICRSLPSLPVHRQRRQRPVTTGTQNCFRHFIHLITGTIRSSWQKSNNSLSLSLSLSFVSPRRLTPLCRRRRKE